MADASRNIVLEALDVTITSPASASVVTPSAVGTISVTALAPVAAAGVSLAKTVLAILTGAIVILMAYLFVMEFNVGSDVQKMYGRIVNPDRIGLELHTVSQIDRMIEDLRVIKLTQGAVLSPSDRQNALAIVGSIGRMVSIPAAMRATVKDCPDPPTDTTRSVRIEECVQALESLRQAAVAAASSLSDLQMAAEFATRINDQRQALHNFWIQAAQLILLNLLLPLLTALMGYVFGTQQAETRKVQ